MSDEKEHSENLEANGMGFRVSIPEKWGQYVGPYLKYGIILFGIGMFVIMVCYGIRLVVK